VIADDPVTDLQRGSVTLIGTTVLLRDGGFTILPDDPPLGLPGESYDFVLAELTR
jgi:hypothetical protein